MVLTQDPGLRPNKLLRVSTRNLQLARLIWLKAHVLRVSMIFWSRVHTEAIKPKGKTMKNLFVLAGAAVLAGSISAWAAETGPATGNKAGTTGHTAEHMTAGTHTMPENKQMHMSNKAMPSRNPNCSEEALAKMPAEHRAACGKKD